MKTERMPVYYPVDHQANFSGYSSEVIDSADDLRPWPVRRRIGIFVAIALVAWAIVLSPFFLIG